MDSVYRKVTVLFRLVAHDSLSAMVLEALARGKYVLYSHTFPHTIQVKGPEDASAALAEIRTASSPNVQGAAYVRENFSWRQEIRRLKAVYLQLLDAARAGG